MKIGLLIKVPYLTRHRGLPYVRFSDAILTLSQPKQDHIRARL